RGRTNESQRAHDTARLRRTLRVAQPAATSLGCTDYHDAGDGTGAHVSRRDAERRGERVVDVPGLPVAALDELSRHAWRAGPRAASTVAAAGQHAQSHAQRRKSTRTQEDHNAPSTLTGTGRAARESPRRGSAWYAR